jgi:hypothetical protein
MPNNLRDHEAHSLFVSYIAHRRDRRVDTVVGSKLFTDSLRELTIAVDHGNPGASFGQLSSDRFADIPAGPSNDRDLALK